MKNLSPAKAIELIRTVIKQEGSQLAAAKKLDISASYLGDILAGKRAVSDQVAKKLGYRRVISYEPIKEGQV